MHYTLYVEKTTGGSSGGSSGGTSGGKSTTSGSTGGKSTTGGKGSTSTTGKTTGGKVTIQKPKDLAKLPPTQVTQPNGVVTTMNMQDFCVLPNASSLNAVAYQQCLARKHKKHDGDVPLWGVIVISVICAAVFAVLIAMLVAVLKNR